MKLPNWLKTFIAKDDMSDYVEPPGIGLAWLWKLPDSHPFFDAAVRHDAEYDLMRLGQSPYSSSYIPDFNFYRDCILAAANQATIPRIDYYLAQARIFYGLVSSWGKYRWKNANV